MELAGYISRCISIQNLDNNASFILQTILLLVAPAVMAASCYMAFGRIILWVVPPRYQTLRYLWMPVRHITPLFVSFDVLSFLVQGIGGGIVASANTHSQANKGKNIVLVGLGIQLVTFGFFVLASSRFSFVLRSKLRNESLPHNTNWPLILVVINTSSVIILIRSISRFLQYALGVHNVLSDSEAYFYCLDAVPIYFVVIIFICFYPAQYLPYIRLRRDKLEFSRNVGRGLFKKLAAGEPDDSIEIGTSDSNP